MARYLDPRNDLTFKLIFGEHPDLLINFLNAMMPFAPDNPITEIEYLPSEQVPDNPGKKNSIVDVKCRDKSKRVFIIEMQMLWTDDFTNRLAFNAGKAYVRQLDRGGSFHLLHPVYTLALLDENFDEKTEEFYHHYQIVNRDNTEEVIEGLEFVLVELKKFKLDKWQDRKIASLWMRFLREVNEGMRVLPEELANNKEIRKAAELCEEAGFTPEQLAAYEAYWDMIRTERTIREGSLARGEVIGIAKGEAIGIVKGEAIGEKKGIAKGKVEKAIVIAKKMLKRGISIEDTSEMTGLSIEQIRELKKQIESEH
jgi:predicted transposase/invertase (TIGR01784 family)